MDNPYQAPSSRVEDPASVEPDLAGRGSRFGAAFLDGIIIAVVLLPMQYASGLFQQSMEAARMGQRVSMGTTVMWSLISIVIYLVIQGYPLFKDAQTWGKKACSIKIVSVDGSPASTQQIVTRCAFYLVLQGIPIIGPFLSLISICLIFRGDKRCGHDLVAGTKVVTA
jgi:uncharacterized RDD family membrane protein YckC